MVSYVHHLEVYWYLILLESVSEFQASGYKCAVPKVSVTNYQSVSCNVPTETRQLITTTIKFQVSDS